MLSANTVKALILDMDGVLWRDSQPIGNLPFVFQTIKDLRLKYILATNNSSKTPEKYHEKLASFGVQITVDSIITSSQAVGVLLKKEYPNGGPVFALGEDGLLSALKNEGFYHQEENALAVVAGLDRSITYEKLAAATLLLRKGATFYGTNPDRTYPSPMGLVPGAGAILAFLKSSSGITPIVAGKPESYLFKLAIKKMAVTPDETLVIGDRIETDLVGGRNAHCQTALVTSGVSTLEDLQESGEKPDFVADDLTTLLLQLGK